MTAAQPLTASAFLFDDEETGRALAAALDEHGVLGSLDTALGLVAQTTREAAGDQVAAVADGVLALDLGDLVIAGWRKQGQLAAAAERTAANPPNRPRRRNRGRIRRNRRQPRHLGAGRAGHPPRQLRPPPLCRAAHQRQARDHRELRARPAVRGQSAGRHRAGWPPGQSPLRGLRPVGHAHRRGCPPGQQAPAVRPAAGGPLAVAAPPRRGHRPPALRGQAPAGLAAPGPVAVQAPSRAAHPRPASAAPPTTITGPAGRLVPRPIRVPSGQSGGRGGPGCLSGCLPQAAPAEPGRSRRAAASGGSHWV